jgi:hypothetical protein
MDDEQAARLDRIEDLLLKLLDALAGDDEPDEEPGAFGAERNADDVL